MSRTRLRQVEQIKNTSIYDDGLNQGDFSGSATEGQPSVSIGANNAIVSTSTSTIVVAQNLVELGLNADDHVMISSSASNNDTYIITSLSYSSPNTTIAVNGTGLGGTTLSAGGASGNAQGKVDPNKSVQRDLNHIRTQLRKLNQKPNWHDDPANVPVSAYSSATNSPLPAYSSIDVGANYEAGSPYELNVYLNGVLLNPSIISSNTIITQYDYQELDNNDELVEQGDIGRKIQINFNLLSGDLFQFVWNK